MDINIRSKDLIYPYFVTGGPGKKEPIRSFPGVFRFSVDRLIKDIAGIKRLGIDKVLLFGVPGTKHAQGHSAYGDDSIVASAVRLIKKEFPRLTVMTDVCLCAYTTHGHCGVLAKNKNALDHKATLEALGKVATAHARAGADYVAPSAMAKGQVAAIRKALDGSGYRDTKIMGYSAKFASNFYGPFRNAAGSAPAFGDRSAYQLDYSNAAAALREIEDDIREGADVVMVKPALSYLDIVRQAKASVRLPVAAYNVSGEYAMAKYGAKNGLWDEKKMVMETLTSIRRAGADLIITYHAKDMAKWLSA
jgi:porphobilinogen synthase